MIEVRPESVRLAVGGDVDLASAPAMRRYADELLEAVAPGGVLVLDLSGVEFLSAAGLHQLVDLARAGRERGVVVRLGAVSELAARVLEVSGARKDMEAAAAAAGLAIGSAG